MYLSVVAGIVQTQRIYGFCEMDDGEIRAHTASAMIGMVNYTVGGTSLDSLVRVTEWAESNLVMFHLLDPATAEAFRDPYRWTAFT